MWLRLVLVGALVSSAAIAGMLVSSEVSVAAGGSYLADSDRYQGVLTVLITGGAGSGWFTPQFTLHAPTDEGAYDSLGATAGIIIGSLVWSVPTIRGEPEYVCNPFRVECALPFTFGVPNTYYIEAWTDVWADGAHPYGTYDVSASVIFDGIFAPRSAPEIMSSTVFTDAVISYDTSSIPEPATWLLVVLGGAATLVARKRPAA